MSPPPQHVPLETRMKASMVSGVIEVLATHPLDYMKTVMQKCDVNQRNALMSEFYQKPYKGVSSRLVGIVPMRVLFWNSITYFKELGYSPVLAGMATAIVQTTVDYPIEQIKTQAMLKNNTNILMAFRQPSILQGCSCNLGRNMGFAVALNLAIDGHDGSYYHGALGGFLGAVLTHPLDSLKTWYQSGNAAFPSHWTASNYWRGWHLRAGISLVSMNIGWVVFSTVKRYLSVDTAEIKLSPEFLGNTKCEETR